MFCLLQSMGWYCYMRRFLWLNYGQITHSIDIFPAKITSTQTPGAGCSQSGRPYTYCEKCLLIMPLNSPQYAVFFVKNSQKCRIFSEKFHCTNNAHFASGFLKKLAQRGLNMGYNKTGESKCPIPPPNQE